MNQEKVKTMVQGAFLAAFNGALGVLNLYLGEMLDILFAYIMILPMVWYAKEKKLSDSILVVLATMFILFVIGEPFFMMFASLSLMMGVFYGEALKRNWNPRLTFYGLVGVSALKNGIVFFLFGKLLGLSVFEEGKEIYQMLMGWLPGIENVISLDVMFVLLWVVLFLSEADIVIVYSKLFLKRIAQRNNEFKTRM